MKFFKDFQNNFSKITREIFQVSQKNFLEPYVVNVYKNFKAGVRFFEEAQDTQGSFEEGGIRIQENSPKSGGREETQTK